MLRNTVDVQAIRNRQKFPKNNYFAYKWRVLDNFNKSIERQQYYMNMWGASNHRTLMNDKILQLYKSRYQGFRQDLIVDLAHDTMQFLQKRRTEHKKMSQVEVTLSKATMYMVDRCFNTLLSFATELNSILGLSELFITASEPEVKKRSSQSESSLATYIQANLSTSLYRLVIEGKQEQLKFYIIPADNLNAMTDIHLQYNPVESWKAHVISINNVLWISSDGPMTDETIEVACVNMLRGLIETTQERLMPATSFENEAAGYDMQPPDPWLVDRVKTTSARNEFEAKSGFGNTLTGIDDEPYGYSHYEDDGWKTADNVPQNSFPQPDLVNPFVQKAASLSITIGTSQESKTENQKSKTGKQPDTTFEDTSTKWQILPPLPTEEFNMFEAPCAELQLAETPAVDLGFRQPPSFYSTGSFPTSEVKAPANPFGDQPAVAPSVPVVETDQELQQAQPSMNIFDAVIAEQEKVPAPKNKNVSQTSRRSTRKRSSRKKRK